METLNTCNPTQKHVSIFNRLAFILISFLNPRDSAKVVIINLLFMKASSQSIAKYTILLNQLVKPPQLFEYRNVRTKLG